MSTVFSRRSFLKYTAVTAVAVAGTSLLGGCSGSGAETAIQTTYPSDNVGAEGKVYSGDFGV